MSHIANKMRVLVYAAKVDEISNWSTPSTEFRKFLGLAGYYR
jgi:hypothetical protein